MKYRNSARRWVLKRALALFCALAALMCASLCLSSCNTGEEPVDVAALDVRLLNVGKADCILISTGSHLVVIDTGTKDTALEVADQIRKAGNTVDALIITHYDKDHIGGVKKILKKNDVKTVYLPEHEEKEAANEVKSAIDAASGVSAIVVKNEISFEFDDASFTVYPTDITFLEDDDDASNMSSLVTLVTHGKKSLLFAGDAEKSRLTEVLTQLPASLKSVDFLKVPHHGKHSGKTDKFLENLTPVYAVITCSKSDPADASVVDKLKALGAKVYFTYDGDVTVHSDGNTLTLGQ